MTKKKKKTSTGARKGFCLAAALLLSGYFLYYALEDVATCLRLNTQIRTNEARRDELLAQKQELEEEKTNLSNPDYAEFVARGKYLVTREGEQIFKFPAIDKNPAAEQEESTE